MEAPHNGRVEIGSTLSLPLSAAHTAISRFSAQALARQYDQIAEMRIMSEIMDRKLDELYRSESVTPRSDAVDNSRKIIEQSQSMIRHACTAGESSARRIARSRALVCRAASHIRTF
jgi:hypothetical protein